MKRFISLLIIIVISIFFLSPNSPLNAESLSKKLSGKILLQVEENGEAWYINPTNEKRYYMGRPTDAFNLMRSLGVGITNKDLEKISVGSGPTMSGAKTDSSFASKQKGKIFLQVEEKGEAWYVYPNDTKRYYLGRPTDAFNLMRSLGLGISNKDLATISQSTSSTTPSSSDVNLDEVDSLVDDLDELLKDQKSSSSSDLDDSNVGF